MTRCGGFAHLVRFETTLSRPYLAFLLILSRCSAAYAIKIDDMPITSRDISLLRGTALRLVEWRGPSPFNHFYEVVYGAD